MKRNLKTRLPRLSMKACRLIFMQRTGHFAGKTKMMWHLHAPESLSSVQWHMKLMLIQYSGKCVMQRNKD